MMGLKINTKSDVRTKKRVMGIDPSTKTGIVLLDIEYDTRIKSFDFDVSHVVELQSDLDDYRQKKDKITPRNRVKRAQDIAHNIKLELNVHRPHYIVIEGYSYASKFPNMQQTEIACTTRLMLLNMNLKYLEVAPTSLKAFTCIGAAKKDMVMKDCYKRWGFEGTDNEVDAFILAMIGVYVHFNIEGTKKQNTTLSNINKDSI